MDYRAQQAAFPQYFRLDPAHQADIAGEETAERKYAIEEQSRHIRDAEHTRHKRVGVFRHRIIIFNIIVHSSGNISPVNKREAHAQRHQRCRAPDENHRSGGELRLPAVKRTQVQLLISGSSSCSQRKPYCAHQEKYAAYYEQNKRGMQHRTVCLIGLSPFIKLIVYRISCIHCCGKNTVEIPIRFVSPYRPPLGKP